MYNDKKVVLITPSYSGSVCSGYAIMVSELANRVVDLTVILEHETGLAKARQRLLDAAFNQYEADIAFFVDDDVFIPPDDLVKMLDVMCTEGSGLVAPLITNKHGVTIYEHKDSVNTLACTLVSREAYKLVGDHLLSSDYCEQLDYMLWPRMFGYEYAGNEVDETLYFLRAAKDAGVKMRTLVTAKAQHKNEVYHTPTDIKERFPCE